MDHQAHIAQHPLRDCLRLHGRVRGSELDALLHSTKVFLSPAVSGQASFKVSLSLSLFLCL